MFKKVLIGIVFTLLAFVAAGYYGYRTLIEYGYPSCALSIEEVIRHSLESDRIQGLIVTDEWQTLGESDERALFSEFQSKGLRFDCYQFPQFVDGSALIGDKGYIRFRKEDHFIRVRIESDEAHERLY